MKAVEADLPQAKEAVRNTIGGGAAWQPERASIMQNSALSAPRTDGRRVSHL